MVMSLVMSRTSGQTGPGAQGCLGEGRSRDLSEEVTFEFTSGHQMEVTLQRWERFQAEGQQGHRPKRE